MKATNEVKIVNQLCRKLGVIRPIHTLTNFLFFVGVFAIFLVFSVSAQQFNQPQNYTQIQPNNNYLRNSTAFRQEIARFEMTVHRVGKAPLSLSQVPRVQQGDVIKVRLLDEAVNGIKLDQSLYNWTLLVAFVNPNRKVSSSSSSRNRRLTTRPIYCCTSVNVGIERKTILAV